MIESRSQRASAYRLLVGCDRARDIALRALQAPANRQAFEQLLRVALRILRPERFRRIEEGRRLVEVSSHELDVGELLSYEREGFRVCLRPRLREKALEQRGLAFRVFQCGVEIGQRFDDLARDEGSSRYSLSTRCALRSSMALAVVPESWPSSAIEARNMRVR